MLSILFKDGRADVLEIPDGEEAAVGRVLMTLKEYDEWLNAQPPAPPTDLDLIHIGKKDPVPGPVAELTVDQLGEWVAKKFGVGLADVKAEVAIAASAEEIITKP